MQTNEGAGCASCGGEMQSICLTLKLYVGALNMLFGFSVGSKARLVWHRADMPHDETEIPYRKAYDAQRCKKCGEIVFRP